MLQISLECAISMIFGLSKCTAMCCLFQCVCARLSGDKINDIAHQFERIDKVNTQKFLQEVCSELTERGFPAVHMYIEKFVASINT